MNRAGTLAFVCPRLAEGRAVGGAETLMRALAERAAARGRRVELLVTCATDHFTWANAIPPGERRIGDATVRFFPVDESRDTALFLERQSEICRGGPVGESVEREWIANSVNSEALCAHLRARAAEYDRIVIGPYLFGLTWHAARIAPERTLLTPCLHDEAFARLRLMRELFHGVRGCLFNTEPEQRLAERLYGLPPERGAVVGMGIEPFRADPAAFAARHGLRRPYVLYCGRREGGKGTPLLTEYLHAFRDRTGTDIALVFTGTGPIEAPDGLRAHILDAGYVSEQEKHEAMAGALAFVHPSTFESLGIVLLESFLAGTPAIVNAGSDVLVWQCRRSGAGLWFRQYPEFEESLLFLLEDEARRRAMGAAGRRYVETAYAWSAVEQRFDRALESL